MSIATIFQDFLNNLKIDNADQISQRYGEITSALNKQFRDTDSKTANTLQVGSYGRWTGIKGISDLDMLYVMPIKEWSNYKDGKQYQLLKDTKDAIAARYPTTKTSVDRLVVTVTYTNFHVEVQPVFEQFDENGKSIGFKYPDTYNGGSWKITKPRQEIEAMKEFVEQKNKNLRRLCKMTRAWKNKHGVVMGGLLIDTLAYNFLKSTDAYDDRSYMYYDWLSRDFFEFLKSQPNQDHYQALGSGQDVKVKKRFQKKAEEAYDLCVKAIKAENTDSVNDKWKKVYGKFFPAKSEATLESAASRQMAWRNTEEFIEDYYPIDIKYNLVIDCNVTQDGFRPDTLRNILSRRTPLKPNKKLSFRIIECDVPEPYTIKWKVLNCGTEAERRDQIRGQILIDGGYKQREERTNFNGNHIVECYAIKDGVVVARDKIDVPIVES